MGIYRGRPGLSPVSAALVAAGLLAPGQRVLDLGCGQGEDAVALAAFGIEVVGVDPEEAAIEAARARAARAGLEAVATFRRGRVADLVRLFGPRSFDAVLDVLTYNNVVYHDRNGPPTEAAAASRRRAYARQLGSVVRPGGMLVLQWRDDWRRTKPHQGLEREVAPLLRDFEPAGPSLLTHLPENPQRRGGRAYTPIGVAVLRRRGA